MSENKQQSETSIAINDKLQDSMATRLRCGGIFNYQVIMNYSWVHVEKKISKSVNIWQSLVQQRLIFS